MSASADRLVHEHVFLGRTHGENLRRTWIVIVVTAAMMVAEILCGTLFGSMALLADGWHMATHVGALSVSALAYAYAARHARDPRFAFGTGKMGDLAGFASAVALALVALWIGAESAVRLLHPVAIAFDEAIGVAVLGLLVNVVCALVLGGGSEPDHDHGHHHGHHHGHEHAGDRHGGQHVHRDNNLRSAYLHVLADALTSVVAIVGLFAGRLAGWTWMDPLAGAVGALMIARWAVSLLRDAGAVLLDRVPSAELAQGIRARLESGGDQVFDLHLWRIGPGHTAAIVGVAAARPRTPDEYRQRLADLPDLSHVTIEVRACPEDAAPPG